MHERKFLKPAPALCMAMLGAAAAAAGCSSEADAPQAPGDEAIALSARAPLTRAAGSLADFRCSAWNATDGTALFDDLVFQKTSAGVWESTPKVYWPAGGQTVDFYAWSPAATVTLNSGHPRVSGYSHAATPGAQEDLLLAAASGSRQTAGDAPVPLLFKHALCKVRVLGFNGSPEYDVKVYGVGMRTLTGGGCGWPDGDGAVAWSGAATPVTVETAPYASPLALSATPANLVRGADGAECAMLLTPFDQDAWNQAGQTHGLADNGGCLLSFLISVASKADGAPVFPASGTYGEAWVPVNANLASSGGCAVDYTVDFTDGVGYWPSGTAKQGLPILPQGTQASVGTTKWGDNTMPNVDASTL